LPSLSLSSENDLLNECEVAFLNEDEDSIKSQNMSTKIITTEMIKSHQLIYDISMITPRRNLQDNTLGKILFPQSKLKILSNAVEDQDINKIET